VSSVPQVETLTLEQSDWMRYFQDRAGLVVDYFFRFSDHFSPYQTYSTKMHVHSSFSNSPTTSNICTIPRPQDHKCYNLKKFTSASLSQWRSCNGLKLTIQYTLC